MRARIYRICIVILLTIAAISGYMAYTEHKPFQEASIKHEAVIKTAVVQQNETDLLDREIDFTALKQINKDIIGWLYIPQIGIDEPILKGQTDEEYLTRSFDGSYSVLGSVFTYSHTNENLSDPHICLFGHNMISGQVFGKLHELQNPELTKQSLYVYTPQKSKELHIESVFSCEYDNEVFQDDWKIDDSQTFTLATCVGYEHTPYRLAVNCKVIKEKIKL